MLIELKKNEATRNRPFGERLLNAPYVLANLTDYSKMVLDEKAWKENDRNGVTVFKGSSLTIVLTVLKKGAMMEKVQVKGFTSIQVMEGKVSIETPDGDNDSLRNDLMVFHPGITYSILAKENSSLLISHYVPAEEDGKIF